MCVCLNCIHMYSIPQYFNSIKYTIVVVAVIVEVLVADAMLYDIKQQIFCIRYVESQQI